MEKRKAKVLALGVRRSKAVRVPWLWVLGAASLPGCLTETQRTMIDSPEDEAPPPPVMLPTPTDVPDCELDGPVELADFGSPIGWAAVSDLGLDGTTGGEGGEVVLARTLGELAEFASRSEPLIIQVCGLLGPTGEELAAAPELAPLVVSVASNKTITGVGTRPTLHAGIDLDDGVSNIIIRNLFVEFARPDGIALRESHHVWMDHLDIANSFDGNLDVTDGSDYVTISWSRFSYTVPSPQPGHEFSNLIGSSDDATGDIGKLRVTLHHNWWADHVRERMPRGRFGDIHVFNNYYSSANNGYCIRSGVQATFLVEGNYFSHVEDPVELEGGSALVTETNAFDATSGEMGGDGVGFTPGYDYELDDALDVPAMVTASSGPQPE